MSVAAKEALESAPRVMLRTARHPAAMDLSRRGIEFESFDSYYDKADSFDSLYDQIADCVLSAAMEGDLVYAVPGHPLVAEESVPRILDRARVSGIQTRVVGSASFIEAALSALGLGIGDGLMMLDALAIESFELNPAFPLLIHQVYDRDAASRVKLALMKVFPDDHEVSIIQSAAVPDAESVRRVPLSRLDREQVDHLTSVYVPVLPPEKRKKTFADLVYVMARLRGEGGCPWDREQDHSTLKRYLIEECYEAIEAIDNDDMDALAEELGDVLLQVVFHAQLEAEVGLFDIDDVIAHIVEKLIRRHPHVFGDTSVADSDEVLRNWERLKREEKHEGWRESVLDGVPAGLPALMRATEISKRAAKVGFDWERFEDVLAKLDEEIAELHRALDSGSSDEVFAELGDLLFTLVCIARWKQLDSEDALRTMLGRFTLRFHHIERSARAQGRELADMSLAEMDALWDEAKSKSIPNSEVKQR